MARSRRGGASNHALSPLQPLTVARARAGMPQQRRNRPMLDAYMYTGKRSPFGRHAGALAKMRPDDMLASVIATVVAESGFAPDKIEDVVVGCGNQGGEDSRCVARHAA